MRINKKALFENCKEYGISGVYAIANKITGERYIGSSKNIRKRWHSHTEPSAWKQQPNNLLYQSMQKYGVENFRFTIVALVEEEHLKQMEQEVIEMFKPEYNSYCAYVTEKGKAAVKNYRKSEKGKAIINAARKKYNDQICIFNGEELTLNALSIRFYRLGMSNPTKEAKKYLVK